MDILEYFLLALRALRANKLRSLLTMLGIIIGVASVILLVSIGTGLQEYITNTFSSLGSNMIFAMPGKVDIKRAGGRPVASVSKFETTDVGDIMRSSTAIKTATPVTVSNAIISYKGNSTSVETSGIWPEYLTMRNYTIALGETMTQSDVERTRKVIYLGSKPAQDLFADADPINSFVTINDIRYQVKGVMNSKGGGGGLGSDVDNQAFIPLTTAFRQFDQTRPYILLIEATDQASVAQATEAVKKTLFKRLKEDDFTVLEQTELLNTINQFLGVITVALGGIAAISLLVGGIGIMNIMLVSVTERTREIGLRKAVGATPNAILIQFLIEAVILSLVGGFIGISLGFLGSLGLRSFIETAVSLWSIVLASGFSALIGIIFGVAPAIRASRLDPIEALRYE
jgi:putative ABC transport system permease protein